MLDVRFSDTEMTADGKTINVFVDDVMSRVEIFRDLPGFDDEGDDEDLLQERAG